jgi:RNA polymerase sigma-70 factor (ECF subfamily)
MPHSAPQPASHFAATEPSAAMLRDADVAAMLKAGDTAQAFTMLVERYEGKVFRLCSTLLKDAALAQDTAQDAFLRVWRALDRYNPASGALSTWIYAIARNRCLSVLERQPHVHDSLSQTDTWEQATQIASPKATNDAASLAWLRTQVDALPTAYRNSLTLFYYEDHSLSEVASMLGLPEGTVKTHLHRARAALHSALRQGGVADATLWL